MCRTEAFVTTASKAQEFLSSAQDEFNKLFKCCSDSPAAQAAQSELAKFNDRLHQMRIDFDRFHREHAQELDELDLDYAIPVEDDE